MDLLSQKGEKNKMSKARKRLADAVITNAKSIRKLAETVIALRDRVEELENKEVK